MGYGQSTTGQVKGDALVGAPSSALSRVVPDIYEYGSITPLTRQGRYKTFARTFSSRPMVFVTPFRSAVGSVFPIFMGTPNTGSFRSRLIVPGGAGGDGSVNCHFIAIGPR